MGEDSQIDAMQAIVKLAEVTNVDNFDYKGLYALFSKFEMTAVHGLDSNSELLELINRLSEIADNSMYVLKFFYCSFLARITKNVVYVEKMLQICIDTIENPIYINFIRWRCIDLGFNNRTLISEKSRELLCLVYKKCYDRFYEVFEKQLRFIPKKQRNKGKVIVISAQVLTFHHAPTKTMLARCSTLKNVFGMSVSIINTRDILSMVGNDLPCYRPSTASIAEEYSDKNAIKFYEDEFEFYQSPVPMPDMDEMQKLIKRISMIKPYYIVNIGGNNITADLCSKIVPVLTVGTVFSSIPTTVSQFRTIGRKLNDGDLEFMNKVGIDREGVIECIFTSDFKKQTNEFSRKDFNLPEDKMLIMLVGWRLNFEIDDQFLEMVLKTLSSNVHYVFIGNANTIKERIEIREEFESLREHCSFLGAQDDLLAISEICDLYVNPIRTGGGMSCVEAMSKGLPVITTRKGDVFVNTGESFAVADYDEMADTIIRYTTDKEFYNSMSEIARKRAEICLDTDGEFSKIINEMLESKLFR